jgi:hypothetical protein
MDKGEIGTKIQGKGNASSIASFMVKRKGMSLEIA